MSSVWSGGVGAGPDPPEPVQRPEPGPTTPTKTCSRRNGGNELMDPLHLQLSAKNTSTAAGNNTDRKTRQ